MPNISDYKMDQFMERFKSAAIGVGYIYGFEALVNNVNLFDRIARDFGLTIDGVLILDSYNRFPIPLINITYFQQAISHETLEYRSIGAEFLALQKGGHLGLRIDMKIPEKFAAAYMILMEMILAYSKPEKKFDEGMTKTVTQQLKQGYSPTGNVYQRYRSATGRLSRARRTISDWLNIDKMNEDFINEAAGYIDSTNEGFDIDDLRNVWRRTCTLVTKETFLHNIYIETLRYGRRNEDGVNYAVINLLFREFRPDDKRVVELKYGKKAYYIPPKKGELNGYYGEERHLLAKITNQYQLRNEILSKTKAKLKQYVKKSVLKMMGLSSKPNAIHVINDYNSGAIDIIDVPEAYDFIFATAISTLNLFSRNANKTVLSQRVGGVEVWRS